jgi:hypothetical protein
MSLNPANHALAAIGPSGGGEIEVGDACGHRGDHGADDEWGAMDCVGGETAYLPEAAVSRARSVNKAAP